MINILIVDDSSTAAALLTSLIEAEADMKVIGHATNGQQAVEMSVSLIPDLITMDINMPVLNGYDATRLIMSQNPTPVVIISSNVSHESMAASFEALEAGAVSVLPKPLNITSPKFPSERQYLIDTLRSMSEIKVFKRRFNIPHQSASRSTPLRRSETKVRYRVLAIGASVGGPQALHMILKKLPANFPLPIVIVQHMAPGFIEGFARWLTENISLKAKIVENNEVLRAGIIYFAPDNHHFVIQGSKQFKGALTDSPPVSGFKPSITILMESVAKSCGNTAIAAILTGMGSDGAKGLLDVKNAHGKTFIQDAESAVVFGMAGVAQTLGAADDVIDLDKIADYILQLTKNSEEKK